MDIESCRAAARRALIRCMNTADLTRQDVDDLGEAIGALFFVFCTLVAQERIGWQADETVPGYLRLTSSPDTIAVPFHLIADFPVSRIDLFKAIAEAMRVADNSVICLSGSAMALGSLPEFGDLDFCEYVEGEPDAGALLRLCRRATETMLCVRLKAGGIRWERPAALPEAADLSDVLQGLGPAERRAKADAVARTDDAAVESTNVVLWKAASEQGGAWVQSFASQEGVLSIQIPRTLHSPVELGNYLRFLKSDMGAYRDRRPAKALKRALAFATVLGLDEAEEVRTLLRNSSTVYQDALEQRQALLDGVRGSACDRVRGFGPQVEAGIAGIRNRYEERRGTLLEEARFKEQYDDLMGRLMRIA